MAVLGLRFCARAFSSCGKRGPLFIVVRGPLIIAASLVEEHRLQTCKLSNCGSRAQLLRGMWDLPRTGLEPVSPALAGRFSTTAPPGKPCHFSLAAFNNFSLSLIFANLITMCLSVFLLGFILYGSHCASWTWVAISFPMLGKFSTIISSNIFSGPSSLSSPSGTPIMRMLLRLMLSQRSLRLSSFHFILFSFFCSAAVNSTILSSRSLIRSSA